MAYTQGLFGNPMDPDTQILVWTKLEELHYPLAGQTKDFLIQKNQMMQEMMAQQQAIAASQQGPEVPAGSPNGSSPAELSPEQLGPEPSPEEIPGETVRLDTAQSAQARGMM